MKTKEELHALKSGVEALNKKLAELSEDELKQVTGGEIDTRKDIYENIILGDSLYTAANGEMRFKCPYCFMFIPAGNYESHKAYCKEKNA